MKIGEYQETSFILIYGTTYFINIIIKICSFTTENWKHRCQFKYVDCQWRPGDCISGALYIYMYMYIFRTVSYFIFVTRINKRVIFVNQLIIWDWFPKILDSSGLKDCHRILIGLLLPSDALINYLNKQIQWTFS